MKQICDQASNYKALESVIDAAQLLLTRYVSHPEVELTVNSTWSQLETEYAQTQANSAPQEIATIILSPYSTTA